MALKISYKKKLSGVTLSSGHVYIFRYQAWQSDPTPTYLHMYAISGNHPNTGRQHRYIQGVNLTYIPRGQRKQFAKEWVAVFKRTNGNVRFTYNMLKSHYPYMDIAIRRYFYSPSYYIKNLKEVPEADLEKVIASSWHKDFSKKAMVSLVSKFRSAFKKSKKRSKNRF